MKSLVIAEKPSQSQAYAAAPYALGMCRTREGCTALFSREDAERLALNCRQPDLEEIMVHLEKEGAQ